MPNLASATIIGHLAADPETSVSQSGSEFVKFRVAVNGFDKKAAPSWFRITCMGKTGEIASEYLHKGDPVCVIGDLSIQEFETRDGETRTSVEVFCKTLTLMGSADGGSKRGRDDDDERPRRSSSRDNDRKPARGNSSSKGRAKPFGDDDDDDDVPL